MNRVTAWSYAFAITCLVELLVAVPLLGREESRLRRGCAVLFGQLATHPVVWFVFPFLHLARFEFLMLVESWAIALELGCYRLVFPRLSWQGAFGVSALANGASFLIGSWLT